MPYKLFPYERRLGLRELAALGLVGLSDSDSWVSCSGDPFLAVHRATYFQTVANGDGAHQLTDQASVESTHLELREGPGWKLIDRSG